MSLLDHFPLLSTYINIKYRCFLFSFLNKRNSQQIFMISTHFLHPQPTLCRLHIVPAQLENNGRQHQDGSQPSATSNQSLDKGEEWFLGGYFGWKVSIAKPRNLVMLSFLLAVFFMFFPSSMILLVSWLFISQVSKRKTSAPFSVNKPLRYKHQNKNLASGTEWPYLN